MKSDIPKVLALLVVTAICALGCGGHPIKNAKEAAGEYIFRYKTGEIETLILKEDLTYRQEFHRTIFEYRQHGVPKYTNAGTWSFSKRTITMNQWLSFCRYPDVDQRFDPPVAVESQTGLWFPPTRKTEAALLFSEEFYYALLRVRNRNEVH